MQVMTAHDSNLLVVSQRSAEQQLLLRLYNGNARAEAVTFQSPLLKLSLELPDRIVLTDWIPMTYQSASVPMEYHEIIMAYTFKQANITSGYSTAMYSMW